VNAGFSTWHTMYQAAGWSMGASVAILAAGLLLLTGFMGFDWDWPQFQPFALLAALPWLLLFICALWGAWRHLWTALEALTGHDLDNSGHVGMAQEMETIRIVPYRGTRQLIDKIVPPEDLRYFIEEMHRVDAWNQRLWNGRKMPSGRDCDPDYWTQMMAILRKVGIIEGMKARSTGYRTTETADESLNLLELN